MGPELTEGFSESDPLVSQTVIDMIFPRCKISRCDRHDCDDCLPLILWFEIPLETFLMCVSQSGIGHLLLSRPAMLSSLVAPFARISNSCIFFSNPILFAIKPPLCSSN